MGGVIQQVESKFEVIFCCSLIVREHHDFFFDNPASIFSPTYLNDVHLQNTKIELSLDVQHA